MKVLMLGPGKPSPWNSGLGIAARHIANYLSSKVELILLEPGQEEMILEDQILTHQEKFSKIHDTWEVAESIVHLNIVSSSPDPYIGLKTIREQSVEQKNEHIQILEEYTNETLERIQGLEYDLIYAHDWSSIPTALRLKQETGKPLVVHFHSLDYDRMAGKDKSWVHNLESQAIAVADAVITVSEYSAGILKEHYLVDPEKVFPIHNGFESYDQVKSVKKVKEDIILFVGRLVEQKGPGLFLEIAEAVHSKNPNTRFVMAGSGEQQKEILETGAYQGFAHKFHFTGHLEQKKLQELYSISSVYCMPSVSEPFGLSAIEAANAGLPMVLSRQCGAAEILDAAYTADYWEIWEFADKILELLDNKKACKGMIEKNRKALQSISWELTADKVLDVFNNLNP